MNRKSIFRPINPLVSKLLRRDGYKGQRFLFAGLREAEEHDHIGEGPFAFQIAIIYIKPMAPVKH